MLILINYGGRPIMGEWTAMLRRVPRDEVTLGMFICSFEGSWMTHPFWRRKFLLDNPGDLAKLLDSEVPAVLVDDERSVPPRHDAPPAAPSAAPATVRARPLPRPPVSAVPSRPAAVPAKIPNTCTVEEEVERARATVNKSKRAVMRMFGEARLGKAIEAANVAPLVDEISQSVARNPFALIGIARLKSKDEYTYMHSVAVCALMINFARTLELDETLTQQLGLAGLIHDVGKMGVPDPVLNKPGKLTDEEFGIVRTHPERGHEMLDTSICAVARDVCLHHHEKVDGSGYPYGLKGEAISLSARMGAICDVYDAVTSNRPYKDGWSPAESITRMLEWQGHFDPKLLDGFVRSIGIYPIGTLVRLRSNRLGVIVGENKREPTHPKVKAFYAIPERSLIKPELVPISSSLRDDAILKREAPEHWNLSDWDKIRRELIGH